MKVVVLSKGTLGYGNFHTGARICEGIRAADRDAECKFISISADSSSSVLRQILDRSPDIVFGIHLRRCSFLTELPVSIPFVIICGGTDLNEDVREVQHMMVMRRVIAKARGIVVFSESMYRQLADNFKHELKETNMRVWTIPQGVTITSSEERQNTLRSLGLLPDDKYFLIVGRIRAVKNPCFAIRPFVEWSKERGDTNYRLLFVGDLETISEESCEHFSDELDRYSGSVKHVDNLNSEACQDVIRHTTALINSSLSEGQALAILEAMAMGTPVIASDIPGNSNLIEHRRTGLLFKDDKTFKRCLSTVVEETALRESMTLNAKEVVSKNHNFLDEGQNYVNVIHSILGVSSEASLPSVPVPSEM